MRKRQSVHAQHWLQFCKGLPVQYFPDSKPAQSQRKEFSLKGFFGETLLGGLTGGFASAAFYGAGKGIERLKESAQSKKISFESVENGSGMYRKTKDSSYVEPMPKRQLRRIIKAFKKQGGIIQMDDATDAYLIMKRAEGLTLNENTILLRQKPGRACVFEELIHATQYRQGLNDGSTISIIQNEIAAQEMLLRNKEAYKLTPSEIKQTQSALTSYIAQLKQFMGGDRYV